MAKDKYFVDPKILESIISPRTRMIILCNPSNPTGIIQPLNVLNSVANILNRPEYKHILVLSDEIYERIVFDEKHVSFGSLPNMRDRTITINGMSKAYGMTGFRLGYIAAHSTIIDACRKLLSQVILIYIYIIDML